MEDERNDRTERKPVIFVVEPVAGETYSPHSKEPMTEEEVERTLSGLQDFQMIGPVDELMPDLGERGFGAFKYYPSNGRLVQERTIIDLRLGDNGSAAEMERLLHWFQYQGCGSIEEHLATISIDPLADLIAVNIKDKITVRMPLVLIKAMVDQHEELERIRSAARSV